MTEELVANFSLNNQNFDALFEINAAGGVWGSIQGEISDQTDLWSYLQLADTALQPNDNISELSNDIGYITMSDVGDGTITIQKNGTTVSSFSLNQATDDTINITVPTTAADVGALPDTTTINDLTTTAQQNALNSGATTANIGQITTNATNITNIKSLIPNQATSLNQLADKDFVNSSIASNTANFIGTFASVTDLNDYSGTVTNNDYAFVINGVVTDNGNDWATLLALDEYDKTLLTNFDYAWVVNGTNFDLYRFDIVEQEWDLRVSDTAKDDVTLNTAYNRYKATINGGVTWDYEYTLNNSSFTAAQWAAINSGVTSSDVTLIDTALQPNDNITQLTNNAGYITASDVGNGTLTIQANGSTVATFTANQSGDTTANISIPDSATWGNITGDLSDQTDLITALNLKQDVLTSANAGTDISIEGGAEEKTVSGNGSITLTDAIEDSLTDVTVSGGTVGLALPLGYTYVDGITNTSSGAKIDTGIIADTTAFEMEVRVKPSTGSWYIFQSRGSSEGITGIGGANNGSTITGNYLNTSVASSITRDASHTYYVKLTCNNGDMTLYVKDETANVDDTQTTTYSTSNTPTENLYLWGNSQNNLVANNTIYMARLKKNGVTFIDYIPCIYNNTAGFYDTASRSFKTKTSTSGAITAGDVLPIPSPTPTNPNYLVCNNGNITCSRNMFKTNGSSGTYGGAVFTVQDDGSVVCSGTATSYSSWTMGRAYVTPNMGEVTVAVDGVYGAPGNITVDRCQVMNSSGTQLTSISWNTWTKSATVDLSNYPTASYIQVSLKRNSNGACSGTIKVQVVKGTTAPTWKPFGQVSVSGTIEIIEDTAGNTATAENLLSIGEYSDTQEILSGTVKRKVGVIALTGTESWSGNASNPYFSLAKSAITPTPTDLSYAPLCTHLLGSSNYTSTAGTVYFGASYLNLNYNNEGGGSSSTARANFNDWLREQYGNGTPVILVYPLSSETTETVTAQTLEVEEGNNTIEITQASISDLPISATYETAGATVISFTNDTGYVTSSDVGNATLTITQGGTTKGTFTANASSDVTINLDAGGGGGTVDQTYDATSTNAQSGVAIAGELADYTPTSSLATVATSGSYTDLSNKPTIPTVNNATLTIQKNGTTVKTFTANASSNVTCNITVPTDTNDLTNNAGYITSSALSGYQTTSNLVTSVSSQSTDAQYPSAKLLYDTIGDIETLLAAI